MQKSTSCGTTTRSTKLEVLWRINGPVWVTSGFLTLPKPADTWLASYCLGGQISQTPDHSCYPDSQTPRSLMHIIMQCGIKDRKKHDPVLEKSLKNTGIANRSMLMGSNQKMCSSHNIIILNTGTYMRRSWSKLYPTDKAEIIIWIHFHRKAMKINGLDPVSMPIGRTLGR